MWHTTSSSNLKTFIAFPHYRINFFFHEVFPAYGMSERPPQKKHTHTIPQASSHCGSRLLSILTSTITCDCWQPVAAVTSCQPEASFWMAQIAMVRRRLRPLLDLHPRHVPSGLHLGPRNLPDPCGKGIGPLHASTVQHCQLICVKIWQIARKFIF